MKEPASILVLRHFPTKYNSGEGGAERSRSWSDIGIDKKAAEPLADKAAKVFDAHGITHVTSSDLPRGKQSADLLASKMKQKPEVKSTYSARTWNTGEAGQPEKEAREKRKQYAKNPDEPMPGGESFNEFSDRLRGFLHTELAKAKAKPDEKRAVILHGHQVMHAEPGLAGEPNKESHWKALDEIKPGHILKLTDGPDGARMNKISGGNAQ
jgi:broad specificity phosphatase PhoE